MAKTIVRGGSAILLDAVTETGTSVALRVTPDGGSRWPSGFTWSLKTTGSPDTLSVTLEGSIDGVTYFTIDTATAVAGEMRHIVNKPIAFIRANLASLTNGTNPTVTVKLASF